MNNILILACLSICPELSIPLVLSWITVEEHIDNN